MGTTIAQTVLAQLRRQATGCVRLPLGAQQAIARLLGERYGGQAWPGRGGPYLPRVRPVANDIRQRIDGGHECDGYEGVWHRDPLAWHVAGPPRRAAPRENAVKAMERFTQTYGSNAV